MKPLITVIIPCYNTEKYLDECLKSVLNQSYNNIEVILVDDGSTDSTSQRCDDYSNNFKNIKTVHQKNAGLSAARNTGIENALGAYLTFVDSDDIIDLKMIETMVDLLNKQNSDIVSMSLKRVYKNDECLPNNPDGDYIILKSIDALKLILTPKVRVISCCGKLFSRKLFDNYKFPAGLYFEDEYSTPRLFDLADTIVISQKDLYYYMQRDNDSIMRGKLNEKKVNDSIFISEDRIKFYESKGYNSLLKDAKIDYYYKLIKLYNDAKENDIIELTGSIEKKKHEFENHNIGIVVIIKAKNFLYEIYKFVKNKILYFRVEES